MGVVAVQAMALTQKPMIKTIRLIKVSYLN
jgi:hypothetical protein